MAVATIGDGQFLTDGNTNETKYIGRTGQSLQVRQSTTGLVGFYGLTPIVQRAGAAQATSLVGTASSADVTTDLKGAVIEIMNTLATIGLWKGSA